MWETKDKSHSANYSVPPGLLAPDGSHLLDPRRIGIGGVLGAAERGAANGDGEEGDVIHAILRRDRGREATAVRLCRGERHGLLFAVRVFSRGFRHLAGWRSHARFDDGLVGERTLERGGLLARIGLLPHPAAADKNEVESRRGGEGFEPALGARRPPVIRHPHDSDEEQGDAHDE